MTLAPQVRVRPPRPRKSELSFWDEMSRREVRGAEAATNDAEETTQLRQTRESTGHEAESGRKNPPERRRARRAGRFQPNKVTKPYRDKRRASTDHRK